MTDLTNTEKRTLCDECLALVYRTIPQVSHRQLEHVRAEILRRYPDPTPEPRVFMTGHGQRFRVVNGISQTQVGGGWIDSSLTTEDLIALGDLARESLDQEGRS